MHPPGFVQAPLRGEEYTDEKFRAAQERRMYCYEPADATAWRSLRLTCVGNGRLRHQCDTSDSSDQPDCRTRRERRRRRAWHESLLYIDSHEDHFGLRVQLKLSSYRLVVTTGFTSY